ncbi:MAG TPA: hypothetical protein VKR21_00960 [Solirubrobacteraceae bacterium]|nr:hypothetical protein [Solirubrobacteraceae bacterium]
MSFLRADLLERRRIAVTSSVGAELTQSLAALGAELELLSIDQLPPEEERVGEWARGRRPLHALVHSAAAAFGAGGEPGLLAALGEAWTAVREVAVGALIESGEPAKLVLLAPPRAAGPFAGAACDGLENLVRTLSVEWARYALTAVLVAPGAGAQPADIAALVAFLVSEAGEYLSGCRLELGGAS